MFTEDDVKNSIDATIEAADRVYRKKANRKGVKEGVMWELDHTKQQVITDIITTMMSYGLCDFYEFSGQVDDTDLILMFDVNDFGTDSDETADMLLTYLDQMKDVAFIPHDGYMTVRFTIRDVYKKV